MTAGRNEDLRLLRGGGLYAADDLDADVRFAGFVRSDMAAGRILAIQANDARAMPGVLGVFTAADMADLAPLTHDPLPRDDGGTAELFPIPVLCGTHVRHMGEPVALVVAKSKAALGDAIDAVWVDMDEEVPPQGVCFCRNVGDASATSDAFAKAAHTSTTHIEIARATVTSLEPRGLIVRHRDGGLHVRASTQNPFALRADIAKHFGLAKSAVHVQASDVGGSFGLKGPMAREDAAVIWAARQLGVDLCWFSTRSEALLADAQGRAISGDIQLAFDSDHRLIGIDAAFDVDAGAYPSRRAMGIVNNIPGLAGMYAVPVAAASITGQLSARPPLAPLRGNGRPEVAQSIERALDDAARVMGVNPVDLRRMNLVPKEAMPFTTAFGNTVDSGDFARVMQTAQDLAGDPAPRRAAAGARGMLYGVGFANCIESAAGPIRSPKPDNAKLSVSSAGRITLAPGVMSVGQGHETSMAGIVVDRLGVPRDQIDYVNGDTAALSFGRGSGGSSGLAVAGGALVTALDRLIDEGRTHAADRFGCAPGDLSFRDGAFYREGSNENMPLAEIAAEKGGLWEVEAEFTPDAATYPNGSHVCEVEVDPETGAVKITRYAAVEDVGRVLNRQLVEGQVMGGVAMGLSFGLGERIVYDDDGQLLTGSFMDYQMIRAADLPMFSLGMVEVPTILNPLGAKGVGEAGTVGSTAAFSSAIRDALAPLGVRNFELPATPCQVWQAIRDASAQ
ncbi:xanthine dehydrogenase family protein molybdopterin-binding subunit [Puniceibacterium sp. IMCC21224]|uniref:xanthine dehydrogenase family protein molybdopterin-binding subunit n=1 Tax=Puniceibacterium sp. IMCC21224 TaxID=1618204 RepID=UPI00065D2321|nr:xanthine dehydrogenase family protein molybdopterin-binding subunit [Puniceibacterium sp. IMCC21224]KMK65045.1 aerobic-type carbon monoxide dehydrogenase, large subunit CoxL/CutL-like protein [Puniceibacterium sp. IMCC21224]